MTIAAEVTEFIVLQDARIQCILRRLYRNCTRKYLEEMITGTGALTMARIKWIARDRDERDERESLIIFLLHCLANYDVQQLLLPAPRNIIARWGRKSSMRPISPSDIAQWVCLHRAGFLWRVESRFDLWLGWDHYKFGSLSSCFGVVKDLQLPECRQTTEVCTTALASDHYHVGLLVTVANTSTVVGQWKISYSCTTTQTGKDFK